MTEEQMPDEQAQLKSKNDAILSIYEPMLEKMLSSTQIITAAGYAGFFAAWANTKAQLSPRQNITVGLSITSSLVLFIAWMVYQAIANSNQALSAINKLISASIPDFASVAKEVKVVADKHKHRILRRWRVVMVLIVVLGFGGALVLMYAFVRYLFR